MEVAQWIPWEIANQEIAKSISFSSYEKKNIQLNWQDWTPKVSSLKSTLSPAAFQLTLQKTGLVLNYGSAEASPSLKIEVGEFDLDQTIYRDFGGNKIGIRIKAHCDPFEVNMESLLVSLSAPFVRQGKFFLPKVQDVKISYGSSPTVSAVRCYGPLGFEQRITSLVLETLKNTSVLESFIKSEINQFAAEKLQSQFQNWMKSKNQDLELLENSQAFEHGMYLKFQLPFPGSQGSESLQLTPEFLAVEPEQPDEAQSLISNESLQKIFSEKVSQQKLVNYNLQSIPSFASFMNNRFIQLFVWSDLLHYSRKAPFYLNTEDVSSLSLQAVSDGQWNVQMVVNGTITSERKSKSWRFLEWSMGISSRMGLNIKEGKAIVSTENSVSNISFNYGAEYQAEFDPGKASAKTLKKALQAALAQKSFEVELPSLLINASSWKMNSWNQSGEKVFIHWVP